MYQLALMYELTIFCFEKAIENKLSLLNTRIDISYTLAKTNHRIYLLCITSPLLILNTRHFFGFQSCLRLYPNIRLFWLQTPKPNYSTLHDDQIVVQISSSIFQSTYHLFSTSTNGFFPEASQVNERQIKSVYMRAASVYDKYFS